MIEGILSNVTDIYFGKTQFQHLGSTVSQYGQKVLVVTGSKSYISSGAKHVVESLLLGSGLHLTFLEGVPPDPTSQFVYEGASLCRSNGIEIILAVGGGSVIDTAKAIGVAALDEGDFFDFFMRTRVPKKSLPVGCVLTLSGTGSEASDGCVIQKGELKYSAGAPFMRPKFAFINVDLMISVEERFIRYGIADSLSHVLERYFTNVDNVATTSYISIALIKSIMTLAYDVLRNPKNVEIRADLVWAQKLAHDETGGFGRKGDWATHTLAHEVAVLTHAAHGEILSIIFPSWLGFVRPLRPELFEFLDKELSQMNFDQKNQGSMEKIITFYSSICPSRRKLSDLGIIDEHIPLIAERSARTTISGTIGNLIRLNQTDVQKILRNAL